MPTQKPPTCIQRDSLALHSSSFSGTQQFLTQMKNHIKQTVPCKGSAGTKGMSLFLSPFPALLLLPPLTEVRAFPSLGQCHKEPSKSTQSPISKPWCKQITQIIKHKTPIQALVREVFSWGQPQPSLELHRQSHISKVFIQPPLHSSERVEDSNLSVCLQG